jgi:hypothetical protein
LFVTKGNFFIVESVENGKKWDVSIDAVPLFAVHCEWAATPYGFGTQPYYRTEAIRPSSSYYALGSCRLIALFKTSVVVCNIKVDKVDFLHVAEPNRETI